MNQPNPKLDGFFKRADQWREEFNKLRDIVLDCQLTEEMKWGQPCYTLENSNVVLIHGFKDYCALLFFKGALLNDPKGILVQQTASVQGPRQIRFGDLQEIMKIEKNLKAYIHQAIEIEKAGLKVPKKTNTEPVPAEFQRKLDEIPALKAAFKALTPGRQRAYVLYFSAAKQVKTRESRVEKWMQQILDGKGLDD